MLDRIVVKKVMGVKQCIKHIDTGKVLYYAKDADVKLIAPLLQLAREKNIKIVEVSTIKELGKMSGIQVNCAATLCLED